MRLLLWALCALSAPAFAQVAATATPTATKKKDDAAFLGGKWYGTAEVRHHINTYYDQEGYYARQEPSTHVRLQLGAQFYDGMVDAYATLGVFKIPETQEIMQRRPEVAVDLYPYRNEYFTLTQYNLLQLPVKAQSTVPMNEDDRAETLLDDSASYTFGLAPTGHLPFQAIQAKFDVQLGLDGWTRLYSRRQYTTDVRPADDEEDDDLALTTAPEEQAPLEDTAMHYRSQAFGGIGLSPVNMRDLSTNVSAHYQSRFDPRYERDEEGSVDYKYGVTRYSYYKIRLRYEINDRLAVTNDFYNFFDGAFQGKREGEDRRFRNIARLSCKL